MDDLQGKIIIVTGVASGIGLATARTLLSSGVKVFGVDVSAIPSSLSSQPLSQFIFHECDLTQVSAASAVVTACLEAFGARIDGLLNVAGVMDTNCSVDTLQEQEWNRVIAVNLTAPVMLMKEVVKVMLKGEGGTIVNVSSKAGLSGAVAGVAYTASKHGLVGATKNVAWRYRDVGIRCNAICPGGKKRRAGITVTLPRRADTHKAVATNITSSVDLSKMDMNALAKMKPIHDAHGLTPMASPEHIASVLKFLCSDASTMINGAVVPVDNSWSTI